MASPPSSRSPSPSPTKPATAPAAAARPPSRPVPTAWSHQETVHLVHIYQDKWYASNRAALKGPQWEEIADAVAARFGDSGKLPPKTPIQCRHKMEKLRKRFRAERQRGGGGPTGWPYYDLMDRLERGPKAPARPITTVPYTAKNQHFQTSSRNFRSHRNDYDEDDEEEDNYDQDIDNNDDDDEEDDCPYSRSQSINYILRRPTVVKRFPSDRSFATPAVPAFVPRHLAPKRAREDAEAEQEAAQKENDRMRKAVFSELAGEIRAFAETYVGTENVKMEMMREAERSRLEMESKRMEMIVESQKKIVEAMVKALCRSEKDPIKLDSES